MKKFFNFSKRGSLSTKIIIGIAIETSALLLLLGAACFLRIKPLNEISFTDKLSTQMRLTDSTLSAFLEGINNFDTMLANHYAETTDEESTLSLEQMIVDSDNYLLSASVILEDETALCYPDGIMDYDFIQNSVFYEDAVNNEGTPYFSQLYENSEGKVVFAAAAMIPDESGDPLGLAILEIDPYAFTALLGDETSMGDIKFIVMDSESNVCLDPFSVDMKLKDCSTMDVQALKNYTTGSYGISREIFRGQKTEVRILPSQNEFCILDYAMLIPISSINASTNAVLSVLLILIVIGLVISVIVAVFIARGISVPLNKLIGILKNISEGDGDLTVRIPENENNELGLLAQYFNLTIEKIAHSMKAVIKESTEMQDVGEKLAASVLSSTEEINEIDTTIGHIKDDISNQSAGVEQTNATLNEIARNIESLNQNIIVQAESVSQSSSAVEQMVANIASVTQILDKNQYNVQALSESAEVGQTIISKTVEMAAKITAESEGLLQATKVIQNIADQTNLLAMNAAIEAAHAGEAGKGFAVVAGEIRKLAEDSNTQGKKISEVLVNFKEVINTMAKDSQELKDQFETIFKHTKTVSTQETVIKNAMDEQKAGSDQVLEAMRKINTITGDVKNSSTTIENGSKEILIQMEKLSTATIGINDSMSEMSNGVKNLMETMNQVTKVESENSNCINRVAEELANFKVEAEYNPANEIVSSTELKQQEEPVKTEKSTSEEDEFFNKM